ncbi:hypothetical protein KO486_12085 [Octadecabacter sp. B2R22]|nr:hypothetical protein [Octadecabacter sp. B2R22]
MQTLDEMMEEQRNFIGPKLPPQPPKMQPNLTPELESAMQAYAEELIRDHKERTRLLDEARDRDARVQGDD